MAPNKMGGKNKSKSYFPWKSVNIHLKESIGSDHDLLITSSAFSYKNSRGGWRLKTSNPSLTLLD